MIGNVENPKIVSSFQSQSKPYGKKENRLTHGFVFKIGGSSEYIIGGERIRLSAGEMIFLPQGTSYEYTSQQGTDNLYTSINFRAEIENPEVRVYSMENFYKATFIYQSFSELWRFGSLADRFNCMSVFYELLSYISNLEHADSLERSKLMMIEPAMDYLKKHIYDCSFRVERLHEHCGISDTYFRKIFKMRFGVSPKEYVTGERISHARSIIESGDYSSISDVAEMVGFADPLYFSKAFKRVFGVSPSGISS